MRKIIELVGSAVAVLIAVTFIWTVLALPGFTVDSASTLSPSTHQEARR